MIAAAIVFSLLASGLVAMAGRREPRLAAAAMVALLLIPLLGFLPKWQILPAAAPSHDPNPAVAIVWLGGTLLLIARLGLAAASLHRLRRSGQNLGSLPLTATRRANLLIHEDISSPFAAGIFRPSIFVPPAWRRWSDETREIVLAHEAAHLRRRDPLWLSLGQLACALHWFNPLVWWLAHRLRADAEFACDAQVVRSGVTARRYAAVLCDLAAAQPTPPATFAMAQESLLRGRVKRLFEPARHCPPLVTCALLGALLLAALLLSLLDRHPATATPDAREIQLRLNANPFPAN
jgi:beta-lactamase regulating signal transducer with metallopeptidase domain